MNNPFYENPQDLSNIILFTSLSWAVISLFIFQKVNSKKFIAYAYGFLFQMPLIYFVDKLAVKYSFWVYSDRTYQISLLLSWVILWSFILPSFKMKTHLTLLIALMIDLIYLPLLSPIFILGENWLIAEVFCLSMILFPSLFLIKSYQEQKNLPLRVFAAIAIYLGWILLIVWDSILKIKDLEYIPLLFISIYLGIFAVNEFYFRGGGTPLPFDKPKKFVTTGIYSYIQNPMQTSSFLFFIYLYLVSHDVNVLILLIVTFLFSNIFTSYSISKEWDLDDNRSIYLKKVRKWLFRLSPFSTIRIKAFFKRDCNLCSNTENFFQSFNLDKVEYEDANKFFELMPGIKSIKRAVIILYEDDGNYQVEQGVRAMSYLFERINIFFAFFAWVVRLPLIDRCIQMFIDLCFGTRLIFHSS